jgi:hypothetical protein
MTGGFKYFLLQTFSYSTDDPEATKEEVDEVPIKLPATAPKATFKAKPLVINGGITTGTPPSVPTYAAVSNSKFADMMPKASVSFKDSGLSGSFKPVETK